MIEVILLPTPTPTPQRRVPGAGQKDDLLQNRVRVHRYDDPLPVIPAGPGRRPSPVGHPPTPSVTAPRQTRVSRRPPTRFSVLRPGRRSNRAAATCLGWARRPGS
jgi:hypothetical protein